MNSFAVVFVSFSYKLKIKFFKNSLEWTLVKLNIAKFEDVND